MTDAPATIAIADDDTSFAEYLKTYLEGRGYHTRLYGHGEELVASVQRGPVPDVILLDVMMPGMDGLATLRQLKGVCSDLQVIMLSGREHATTIVEALSLGAVNYVIKPSDPEGLGEIALDAALKQAIARNRPVSEVPVRRQVNNDEAQALLVRGRSEAMRKVALMIERVADSDVTVLVRGESGVGKELVARAIHDRSPRRARPFVKVNCAALPDDLLESELFGHEKGSFTGASALRIGKFEHAHKGTLMLDEIGEMKTALQGKLLHVLQDGEFSRLGSNKRVAADVRIVAATNRDLESMLVRSEFREDLYYRLKVIEITVPPLRARTDELHPLFEFFARKYARQYNRSEPSLSPSLLAAMERYHWPGNIRELENVVKRFVILQDEALLRFDMETAGLGAAAVASQPYADDVPAPLTVSSPQHDAAVSSLPELARAAMLQAERDLIIPTLHRVHWNRRKAAPLLGISYKTLLNKIKEHGIIQE